ncbi:alpha/beta hydrolase fold domain-containing protein [Lacticaseibacillus pabuli]|uniref:Alpha/beta hydrolase fold domain-containing protein n=1 Tax=Lacticaseibacillus pabuli TaxID=3025672 RepID=A0ABY7WRN7_9LACO|nr:alpha/beta hydrolase fold domain-containing protein [Lacticaseibacillus sp. KACC 23028]WDF82771.1 alpha/beta hydrolase fold domain-containing protein [Lacticaseibacillus sp. KACC 23028]
MPKVKFTQAQRNTVSKEAAATISTMTGFDLPNFIPLTKHMILNMRKQFQTGEDKNEMAIIDGHKLNVKHISLNGVPGMLITAPDVQMNKGVIFNVHGGGFIMGTARDRNGLLAAAETKLPVYSVDYTLSPEATALTVLGEVEHFYQGVIEAAGTQPITIMGSSAGSTIAASTIVRAHTKGMQLPAAAVLMCPALDISGNGDSAVFNDHRDALSTHLSLRLAQSYIGDNDPLSPDVSPMYATIGDWFPPTVMTTGTRDAMLSNVLRFTDKLKDAKVPNHSIIKDGMWHGFTWEENLPEAIATRKEMWQWIMQYNKA